MWRHLVVGSTVVGCGALAWYGVIGAPRERYDQWQVVITPGDGPALNVSETIDYDMAGKQRHGVRRLLPTDFGTPTDISASVDGAGSEVSTDVDGVDLEVQVGDPDVTVTGQHRYELSYTLPDAQYEIGGRLSVDLTGNLDFPVTTLRGTLSGFQLTDTACFIGDYESGDRCDLNEISAGVYQAELHDVPSGEFVTIEGTVESLVAPGDVSIDPPAENPDPPPDPLPTTLGVVGFGSLAAAGIFIWARRRGRNQVYAGGPSDAAAMPTPSSGETAQPTQLVTDARLGEMATTEFEPPRGVAPWEGAVALSEHLDEAVVQAYISGLAGSEAIKLDKQGKNQLAITAGPKLSDAPTDDQEWVHRLLSIQNPFVTGSYDKEFAKLMNQTRKDLGSAVRQRGWWRRGGPGKDQAGPVLALLIVVVIIGGSIVSSAVRGLVNLRAWLDTPWSAVLFAVVLTGLVALIAYQVLLPSRTAAGSAVALQTESFRRFLHASEAQHVEWAWKHELLREYSAWAVALGEAEAWSKALKVSSVPERDSSIGPMYVYSMRSSFSRSTTSRSSSSGGGFSGGGFAGGGGGGGGGGGW